MLLQQTLLLLQFVLLVNDESQLIYKTITALRLLMHSTPFSLCFHRLHTYDIPPALFFSSFITILEQQPKKSISISLSSCELFVLVCIDSHCQAE
ncbi:hypothetical protein MRB53_032207 [Persea americana]|uniref:Uncharacterized protein n=1 Tax=Persea americana TaxID=3435 RepID=A0ACC2KRJ4_PERAE|nr:hypothetical protein MRB53_032207 [Persea americana]